MTFFLVLTVRAHIQDLVAMQPEISIFQLFSDIFGLVSSTTSYPFVDDPDLELTAFIGEGADVGGVCGNSEGLFGVGFHNFL